MLYVNNYQFYRKEINYPWSIQLILPARSAWDGPLKENTSRPRNARRAKMLVTVYSISGHQ